MLTETASKLASEWCRLTLFTAVLQEANLKLEIIERPRVSRGSAAQAWQPADKSQRGACHRSAYAQQVAVRELRALTRAGAPDPAHLGGCPGKAATPTPNGENLHPNGYNLHTAAARGRSAPQLSGRPRPQGLLPSKGTRAGGRRPTGGAPRPAPPASAARASPSSGSRRQQAGRSAIAQRAHGATPGLTPPRAPARPPCRPARPRS